MSSEVSASQEFFDLECRVDLEAKLLERPGEVGEIRSLGRLRAHQIEVELLELGLCDAAPGSELGEHLRGRVQAFEAQT